MNVKFTGIAPECTIALRYTVTFFDEDGRTVLTSEKYDYGALPVAPVPTRDETEEFTYTFLGWNKLVTAVTGIATYIAQFAADRRSYLITFLDEDGSLQDAAYWDYGCLPHPPSEPEKPAEEHYTYKFAGWDQLLSVTYGEATYRAVFTAVPNKYLITFVDEDGTLLASDKVDYGTMPVAPADPSKPNDGQYTYSFAGWTPEVVEVTADASYTATYNAMTIPTVLDNTIISSHPYKLIKDGQLLIFRGGKIYTIQGQEIIIK